MLLFLFSNSSCSKLSQEIPKCDPGLVVLRKVLVKRVLCGKRLGNAACYGVNVCVSIVVIY